MVLGTRRDGTNEATYFTSACPGPRGSKDALCHHWRHRAQVHQEEPRTTIDIDVAVATYGQLPRAQLEVAGFLLTGRFSHLENWIGLDNTPVQFTDDPALAEAITRAETIRLEDVRLRVLTRVDLLHEKLRAASDPARRRSKRLQDLADVQGLLETTPELEHELTAEEHAVLEQLPL